VTCIDLFTNRTYSRAFLDIRKAEHRQLVVRSGEEKHEEVPIMVLTVSTVQYIHQPNIPEAEYVQSGWFDTEMGSPAVRSACNRCHSTGSAPVDGEQFRVKRCLLDLTV